MLLYVGLIVSYLPPALEKINPKIAQVHLDPQDPIVFETHQKCLSF